MAALYATKTTFKWKEWMKMSVPSLKGKIIFSKQKLYRNKITQDALVVVSKNSNDNRLAAP